MYTPSSTCSFVLFVPILDLYAQSYANKWTRREIFLVDLPFPDKLMLTTGLLVQEFGNFLKVADSFSPREKNAMTTT